jgi:hypothetical protein
MLASQRFAELDAEGLLLAAVAADLAAQDGDRVQAVSRLVVPALDR